MNASSEIGNPNADHIQNGGFSPALAIQMIGNASGDARMYPNTIDSMKFEIALIGLP